MKNVRSLSAKKIASLEQRKQESAKNTKEERQGGGF